MHPQRWAHAGIYLDGTKIAIADLDMYEKDWPVSNCARPVVAEVKRGGLCPVMGYHDRLRK